MIPFLTDNALRVNPEKPAIISQNLNLSYSEYVDATHILAWNLYDLGLRSGDRIAVLAENSPEYVILIAASLHSGITVVPLSTRLPDSRVDEILSGLGCRLFITDTDGKKVPAGIKSVPLSSVFTRENSGKPQPSGQDQLVKPDNYENSEASIIFTSGSMGSPKGVLHTFANHYYSAVGSNLNIRLNPGDVWLVSLGLYHVGGFSIPVRTALAGAACALPGPGMSLFESISRFNVTHISLVAAQLQRLMEDSQSLELLKRMKAVLLGGGSNPVSLIKDAVHEKIPLYTTYGSTEMCSQVTTTGPVDDAEKLLSSGKLLKHRECKISETGEILIKGETLCKGYFQNGEFHSLDQSEWSASGDLGYFGDDGYLNVIGRKDSMFISGGENIHPEEIEQALNQIPEIEEAVVVPVHNAAFGMRPAAFLRMGPNKVINCDVIRDGLKPLLPGFKIPDFFLPWPAEVQQTGIKPSRSDFIEIAENMVSKKR